MTNKTESCFGNFNGQLEKCIYCEVAVECHEASKNIAEYKPGGAQDENRV